MTSQPSPSRPARVQSVDRTIDVLEALAEVGGIARSKEIAQTVGLPVPTVHRLLATLNIRGYVLQLPDRRYALGARLVRLGTVAAQQSGAQVQPALDRLVARLEETVNLAFLTQDTMTYVAQASSHRSMRMFTEVGRRVALHTSGVGKAVLTTLPEAQVRDALATAGTRDLDAVLSDVDASRERGYAIDDEEQEVGVRCLAVAVPGGPAPAALSVSGPSSRLGPLVYEQVAAHLRATAQELAEGWALDTGV
ncbi:IclR family transcriptional regulator [Brevibacterium jeotgali]|uniref:Glycerol operon regulatory protein n=1 Tax=Brevibacterium jeotgali TaxID=1262550 RepID=A0A2H1L3M4_9MICO|nr:IclR family transcriptional regulator [Brevibacterium jeotgali]TWC02533.1 IclR family transcriptional regulator [Brevibacterium jeotgali]SMY11325.1 transcriptional regulator, IclR family [Brevibacterium jeotgali]